jgi:hypothetical protein
VTTSKIFAHVRIICTYQNINKQIFIYVFETLKKFSVCTKFGVINLSFSTRRCPSIIAIETLSNGQDGENAHRAGHGEKQVTVDIF